MIMRYVELGKTGVKNLVLGQGTHGIYPDRSKEFYEDWRQSYMTQVNGIRFNLVLLHNISIGILLAF